MRAFLCLTFFLALTFVLCAAAAAAERRAVSAGHGIISRIDVPAILAHEGEGAGSQAESHSDNHAQADGWHHFVRWVGHFHPPMTAFPIAMLLSAALAELLLIISGRDWLAGASR